MTTNQNFTDGYLTPQDLVERFGLSLNQQSLMRMKKRQKHDPNPLPFVKIGRKIFYIANQIEAWMIAKQSENSACYKTEYLEKLYAKGE